MILVSPCCGTYVLQVPKYCSYDMEDNPVITICGECKKEIDPMEDPRYNMASCMLSILDTLKLFDTGSLDTSDETLSEMMFRKMKAYNIDLNKELGFIHLKPIKKNEKDI